MAKIFKKWLCGEGGREGKGYRSRAKKHNGQAENDLFYVWLKLELTLASTALPFGLVTPLETGLPAVAAAPFLAGLSLLSSFFS